MENNKFNRQLADAAKRRRGMYYRLHLKGMTVSGLARKYGVSRQRMSVMLLLAAKDAHGNG